MTIFLTSQGMDASAWANGLRAADPNRRVIVDAVWSGEPIDYVVAWNADPAVYARLQDVKVVFSLGAGVDHLLKYADQLPPCPVVRISDPDLTSRMSEWVVLQVLFHHRQSLDYLAQQHGGIWRELEQPAAHEMTVGILGYGTLGADAAAGLSALGFKISAWSRTEKPLKTIRHFAGAENFSAFLNETDILVNLLPATPDTHHLVDYSVLKQLRTARAPVGPIYINGGRGATQVGSDILKALDDGTLRGASVDVFETEPLPSDDPLWRHPRLIITPHMAASSSPLPLSRYIMGQVGAFEAGQPLQNVVDFKRGY